MTVWSELVGEGYEIEDLGRPAVFLLPSHKLREKDVSGRTVEERLHDFLVEHFGAFTTTTVPYFGFWRNDGNTLVYDECRLYEVSFSGKDRIPLLLAELAAILPIIKEDCLYFKAGQYTCLLRPKASA